MELLGALHENTSLLAVQTKSPEWLVATVLLAKQAKSKIALRASFVELWRRVSPKHLDTMVLSGERLTSQKPFVQTGPSRAIQKQQSL